MVTQIYEIQSDILGDPSPEIWRPKNMKFLCDFGQLCNLIANFTRTQQDIVNRKMALQSTGTPA